MEGLGSEYMATPCRLNLELHCVRVPGVRGYNGLYRAKVYSTGRRYGRFRGLGRSRHPDTKQALNPTP